MKPATPSRHLVSYVAVIDHADYSSVLVDHIHAGLWRPPGGHVEPEDHPATAAAREAREELAIDPTFVHDPPRPSFLTITRTVGTDTGHTDVSLWFVMAGTRDEPVTIDRSEFTEAESNDKNPVLERPSWVGRGSPEPPDHALGRSRGGFTSKLHLICDGRGRPISVGLTSGNVNDTTMLWAALGGIRVPRRGPGRPRTRPDRLLGGKATHRGRTGHCSPGGGSS